MSKTHGTDSAEEGSELCGHPRCPMLPSALGSWGQGGIVNMPAVIGLMAMFDQLVHSFGGCMCSEPSHPIATNSRGPAGVNESSSLRLKFMPPSHAGPARWVHVSNALYALPWFVAVMGSWSRNVLAPASGGVSWLGPRLDHDSLRLALASVRLQRHQWARLSALGRWHE